MSSFRANNKALDEWLHSVLFEEYEQIPYLSIEYEEGQCNENKCVFCDDTDLASKKLTIGGSVEGIFNVSICKQCMHTVNSVLSSTENPNGRRLYYLKTGNMPSNTSDYTEGEKAENRCVFCDEPFDKQVFGRKIGKQIWLPQGHINTIYGPAHCCLECEQKIAVDQQHYQDKPRIREICVKCGDMYPVNSILHEERESSKTVGQHVCDQCLIDSGLRGDKREEVVYCNDCNKSSKTIDKSHIDYYPLKDIGPLRYVCSECISPEQFKYLFTEDIEIHTYKLSSGWYYSIMLRDDFGNLNKYVTNEGKDKGFNEPYLATMEAVTIAHKRLHNNQKRLDYAYQ